MAHQEEVKRFKLPKVRVKYPTPWGILPYKGSVDLPQSWRNGSQSSFRILEWACPLYSGYKRFGIFDCVQESFESRCKQVYLRKKDDSKLIIIARPENIISAQPLLKNGNGNLDPSNKRLRGHKMPGERKTTYYKENGYVFQRYHYRDDCQSLENDNRFVEAEDSKFVDTNNNNYRGIQRKGVRDVIESKMTEDSDAKILERQKREFSKVEIPIISRRHLSPQTKVIGEGAFGTVSLTKLAGVKQVVAKSFNADLSSPEEILTEAKLQAYLRDTECVPQIYGVSYGTDFRMSLIQEYCANGVTLFDMLHDLYDLDNKGWIKIIRQLAAGLNKIHLKGVLLNDLKEDNILVDCQSDDYGVKFIDFGLATSKESITYNVAKNERHLRAQLAPEVLDGQRTTPSSDMFGLGRMLENISYQCDICGLSDIAEACLSDMADKRPNIYQVINMINNLQNKLLQFDSDVDF